MYELIRLCKNVSNNNNKYFDTQHYRAPTEPDFSRGFLFTIDEPGKRRGKWSTHRGASEVLTIWPSHFSLFQALQQGKRAFYDIIQQAKSDV